MADDPETPDPAKKDAPEAGAEESPGGGGGTPPPIPSQTALTDAPPKPDMQKRVGAALIDVAAPGLAASIVFGIGQSILIVGPLLGAVAYGAAAAYIALRDSMNGGRSFGKQNMGLRAQNASGGPPTQEESIKRNAILAAPFALLAVASLLTVVPLLGHLLALPIFGIATLVGLGGLYEALQVVGLDPEGRRLMERKTKVWTVEE